MLLDFPTLVKKYSAKIDGAIHCGSHLAQEHASYVSAGIKRFAYIEPCAATFTALRNRFGSHHHIKLFNVACGEADSEGVLYTGSQNEGQSNSLLKMHKHTQIHPGITLNNSEPVQIKALDSLGLFDKGYQLLVMDCQGFEGRVVKGAEKTLRQINYVYSEVNLDEVYKGCTLVDELDALLPDFERVETGDWVGGMWSDAWYVRKTFLHHA